MGKKKDFLSVQDNGLKNQNVNKMKLYTRKQMIEAFKYGQNPKGFDWIGDMIDSLKPIKLPNDNKIEKKSEEEFDKLNPFGCYDDGYYDGFIEGAKWVIEQIKKQSDEHNTNKG